jgi:ankyrin repeat protein
MKTKYLLLTLVLGLFVFSGCNINYDNGIENKEDKGKFHRALFEDNAVEILERDFFNNGLSINYQDEYEDSILHNAVKYKKIEIVEYLLENGADVNIEENDGQTPLFNAAIHNNDGDMTITKLLLKKGANINHKDNDGKTPLILASTYGNIEFVKILLKEENLDLNVRNSLENGGTALTYANSAEVIKLLEEAGATE